MTDYDRQDNNKFVSKINKAIIELDSIGDKITPVALARASGFTVKDIELNLYEINKMMDVLGID